MAETELKIRIEDLVDKIAEKLNWLLVQKFDKSNVKGYLNSTNPDHVPNIPAVVAGIAQAVIQAGIYTDEQINILLQALNDKVDKIPGKGLSANDFTNELKQKLEELEGTKYRGAYPSLNALKQAYPEGENESWHHNEGGWYADVGVEGSDDVRYVWDPNDFVWIQSSLAGLTPEQVKQLYLQNSDTNNFSDLWLSKLQGIEDGAQKNVQSDWDQTNSNNDAYIKNKPTKLSQFQNDPNFVSQQWVLDQEYLTEHQSLEGYALLTDIKNGKLTLKATGALSGGTKEFTANQDGNTTFTVDLTSTIKAAINQGQNKSVKGFEFDETECEFVLELNDDTKHKIEVEEIVDCLPFDNVTGFNITTTGSKKYLTIDTENNSYSILLMDIGNELVQMLDLALQSDIKDGTLTLKAEGYLTAVTETFSANQAANTSFTIDLSTDAKNKIDEAYNGKIVSVGIEEDELVLTTHDDTEIKLDLEEIKDWLDLPTKLSEFENDEKFIKGDGIKKITVGQEPQNPDDGDFWLQRQPAVDVNSKFFYKIDKEKIEEELTDFPVYLDLSKLQGSSFWDIVKSDGSDIRAYDADHNQIALEVVWIDKIEQKGEVYVKANLSDEEDTEVYLTVDGMRNALADNHQFGKYAVWSNNYIGVYHQKGEDSSGQNNLARHTPIEKQESKIGEGYELTLGRYGFGDYNTGNIKSLSFLFKQKDIATEATTGGQVFGDIQETIKSGGNFKFVLQAKGTSFPANYGSRSYGIDNYTKDGELNASRSIQYGDWYHYNVNLENNDAERLHIGNNRAAGSTYTDNVELDEIRVSNIDRSESWAKAEYENLLNSEDFYTTREEQEGSNQAPKPKLFCWNEVLQEWEIISGEDDSYPDYAQMLEDLLNF